MHTSAPQTAQPLPLKSIPAFPRFHISEEGAVALTLLQKHAACSAPQAWVPITEHFTPVPHSSTFQLWPRSPSLSSISASAHSPDPQSFSFSNVTDWQFWSVRRRQLPHAPQPISMGGSALPQKAANGKLQLATVITLPLFFRLLNPTNHPAITKQTSWHNDRADKSFL